MTYDETLTYLYTTLPMFSRMGSAAYKKDLTNTVLLCGALRNPHQKFKSVHVAGTNGKGSVTHAMAAVFQKAGYKTGLYTSPHLYDFRERIRCNGAMIAENFVVDFVAKQRALIESIQPSFFEITVAMAFDFFAVQNVDIAIIEVGLGGRLDSTNIIQPELSIITNIGWDHTNLLGNTLAAIAFEKAGIIKQNTPVVIGQTLPETKPVFEETAAQKNAPIYFAEDLYQPISVEPKGDTLQLEFKGPKQLATKLQTDLAGMYQAYNIATVLTATDVLESLGWKLQFTLPVALKNVKKHTGLMGRWDIISHRPDIILDVAHNKEGIEQLLQHVHQILKGKLHLVFGVVKDKDVAQLLKLLPATASYYFTAAHIPRALPAADLRMQANSVGLMGKDYDHVNDAVQAALSNAEADDLIIVCGSIFLVAEVTKELFSTPASI